MRLSRDNWIVLGILAVVTATYVLVIYRWQVSRLEGLRERLAAKKRQLDADAEKAATVPVMVREIEQMKRRYGQDWARRLPRRQELAEFLREISANLSQERLANAEIAPGEPIRGPLYNVLPISMRFEGKFLSLARFLSRVEHMTRLTRIEQLSIQPKPDSDVLSVELGMNIYFTEPVGEVEG